MNSSTRATPVSLPAVPLPSFAHLRRLTDAGGLFEHAEGTVPRPEHAYCIDDVARALVVVCREGVSDRTLDDLRAQYLEFVLDSQGPDGRFRNRRDLDGHWLDAPTVEDCWGRALWGLGAAVAGHAGLDLPLRALDAFERGAQWRSPYPRATAFAGLGAAAVLEVLPAHVGARELVGAAAQQLRSGRTAYAWAWPEPRLTYANAAVPEVLIAAGALLGDAALLDEGLTLLDWLLSLQTRDGHLSVVPVDGVAPSDLPLDARFDQQPIEVAHLADACARAFAATGDVRWADGVDLAVGWFLGANDAGVPLHDVASGGGCDGLEHDGRNENQGAESTLALISTLQHARWLAGRTA